MTLQDLTLQDLKLQYLTLQDLMLKNLTLLALTLLAVAALAPATGLASDPPDPRRILHLLHYVAKDYPEAAASREADELVEQRGFLKEAGRQLALLPDRPERAHLATGLFAVLAMVSHTAPPDQVEARLEEVASELTRLYPAELKVPSEVSLESGRRMYALACASCHGVDGRAAVPVAAEMHPRPARFVDPELMAKLAPANAFDTISFGVNGTPMPSFLGVLSEQERWDLAFYVFTLRTDIPDAAALPAQALPLDRLATMTDAQLETTLRGQGVPGPRLPAARQALRTTSTYQSTSRAR